MVPAFKVDRLNIIRILHFEMRHYDHNNSNHIFRSPYIYLVTLCLTVKIISFVANILKSAKPCLSVDKVILLKS